MISAQRLIDAIKRFGKAREGASVVELGVCLPLIAGIIIPLTDLGMGAYTQMEVANAAQAGAEYAAAKGFNSSGIVSAISTATSLAGVEPYPAQTPSPSPMPTQSCSCVDNATLAITAATPASPPPTPPATQLSCTQTCPNGKVGLFVTVTAQANYTPLFNYPFISSPLTLTAQSVIRIK